MYAREKVAQEKIKSNLIFVQVSDALLKLQKPASGEPARAGYLADISKQEMSCSRKA